MKFFLHIGTEKTGTTAIQRFLEINRSLLDGYGYGTTEKMWYSHYLSIIAYDLDRRDGMTRSNEIYTDKDLLAYQKKVKSLLLSEIKKNNCPNFIFSSELIQSRLTKINELQRLKNILVELGGDEFKIIIYIRNPIDTANSLYSTAVKFGSVEDSPPTPGNPYYQRVCNHQKTLEDFGIVFGEENLIPRLYDGKDFKNGSLFEDFIEAIGGTWDQKYIIPPKINESLSEFGIKLLSRFNKKVPRFIDGRLNPKRKGVVDYFESHFSARSGQHYSMSQKLCEKYRSAFAESNDWVRRKWFPDKAELFPERITNEQAKIQIDNELESIANMIADIWVNTSIETEKKTTSNKRKLIRYIKKILDIWKRRTSLS